MRRLTTCCTVCGLLSLAFTSCADLGESPVYPHDPQNLKIQFQYGFRDELNTFAGTYTKDLVLDGTITVPFWLTASEQETILHKADSLGFFSFPDTVYAQAGVYIDPNPGPDMLRLEYDGTDKTVVWHFPPEGTYAGPLYELSGLIQDIITSKPEYKDLPPARGGYI